MRFADGRAQGYALGPVGHSEPVTAIDPERDTVEPLHVHVFHGEEAARAFQKRLILGGDEDTASIVGVTPPRLGGAAGEPGPWMAC
ncbi:MAG: hypothetical protein ACREXX_03715 [Gammaproteobacteria bacterium]